MKTFPKIETERLILKELRLSDAKLIAKYAGNKKIYRYTLNIPHPYSEEDAVWWINNAQKGFEDNRHHTFGIYLKSTDEFIGGIGLVLDNRNQKASSGYWVAEPFWNKGFMTEGHKALIAYAFDVLKLNKVFASHLIENPASGKVMINSGMVKEGELKEHNIKDGVFRSLFQYRILKSEFNSTL